MPLKLIYLFSAMILLSFTLSAQKTKKSTSTKTVKEPEVYTKVDETAEYATGTEALQQFIKENLNYPPTAIGSGKCNLKLTVNETGKIVNSEVLKGVPACSECDTEAQRLLTLMPNWKPATVKGKAVKSYVLFSIEFVKPNPQLEESNGLKKKYLD